MEKMRDLTFQLRQNQAEVGDFLKDLDSWTSDIKKQDENLKTMKPREKMESSQPPIRSKAIMEKVKKKNQAKEEGKEKKERIKSSDYRKWEKLDIDAMCKEVDEEEEVMDKEVQVEIDKLDAKRKEKVAKEMKEKGNEHFKNKGYQAAIECYTTGMMADPSNPTFPANRAMAYLKLEKYSETEADCTLALSLDPSYTKAYLRRGAARIALGKSSSAKKDYLAALKLEPGNSQAKAEIHKLNQMGKVGKSNTTKQKNVNDASMKKSKYVYPIFIPPRERSKKPLMRVEVQEIGFQEEKKDDRISKEELDSILGRTAVERKSNQGFKTIASNDHQSIPVSTNKEKVEKRSSEHPKVAKTIESKVLIEEVISADSKTPKLLVSREREIEDDIVTPQTAVSSNAKQPKLTTKLQVNSIPDCPTTSFQFQAHVKQLCRDSESLLHYLLKIPPERIPSLLKQQLETETLVPVLKCLEKSSDHTLVMNYVTQFSKVGRFDMAVMFMSDMERKEVQSLFMKLKTSLPEKLPELDNLMKKYGL